jgi:hypothetical protein
VLILPPSVCAASRDINIDKINAHLIRAFICALLIAQAHHQAKFSESHNILFGHACAASSEYMQIEREREREREIKRERKRERERERER